TDTDEGDSSVRAGNYDQDRTQSGRSRDTAGQSGSTGRYAGYGDFGQGDYSGGRRGFSGQGSYGQYGRDYGSSGTSQYGRSDYRETGYGSARGDRYSQGTFGTERGGWNEPYREGQQYTSRGDYSGASEYGAGGRGMGQGQHRGKGPKGYQRSDERIKELLCERLHDDPDIDPSDVTITVTGGRITLEGTVDSRQTKNAIEDVAEQFGVQDVQNNLRVQRQAQAGIDSSGRTTSAAGKGTGNDETGTKTKQH
ncbi:MAG TPA: BON domain-containing protein, partial [Steroidobacteraceae bacterium]|nr:BON domain-containing protein [Steroidobacteraceae bacterium]